MTVLSLVLSVALLTWLSSIWARNWEKPVLGLSVPGLMSFCAKNARTTTMRMGKAALLKNLLMSLIWAHEGPGGGKSA